MTSNLKYIFLLCVFFQANILTAQKKYDTTIDDITFFVPAVSVPLWGLTGIKSKHSFKERLAVTITAVGIDGILTEGLKYAVHSKRPDGTDYKSFPSGHTSLAFTGAEIIREEYGWGWGLGAYLWSVGVGTLRICHHRHRFIDVLGGAAIGVGSARLGYLLLPLERKIFKWDKSNQIFSVVPSISKETIGGSFCLIF